MILCQWKIVDRLQPLAGRPKNGIAGRDFPIMGWIGEIGMGKTENGITRKMADAWRQHGRQWKNHRYVYAVVSRRSRGVSIGLNLNPNKVCNFDCVYCQVNRTLRPAVQRVNLRTLAAELDSIPQAEANGSLYEEAPFDVLSTGERGVRDIAFSGDGEPTLFRRFGDAVQLAAAARQRFGLRSAKLVLLTNAAFLHKPSVRTALEVLDANNGEIWAKVDAGSEEYFRKVNRAGISLDRILGNILDAARIRPIVIQTLWLRIHGAAPPDPEIAAYCDRLDRLMASGGRIKKIQLHTIARNPAEPCAAPLSRDELERIAAIVGRRLSARIEVFHSG